MMFRCLTAPFAALALFTASADAGEDAAPKAAAGLTTIHKFTGGPNGANPLGGVVADSAGNLYGTTFYQGSCTTCGIIYKLTKPAAGKTAWTFKVLHRFQLGPDGIGPSAPMIIRNNLLYGTTFAGGDPTCGCGVVFRIGLNGQGYTKLYTFRRPTNKFGSTLLGGLAVDGGGFLYGTNDSGGLHGAGTIFRVSPTGAIKKLHDFTGNLNGGPQGELLIGKDGLLYGTQFGGGTYNQGTIFKISKTGTGFKVLHHFKGVNQPGGSTDGANPQGRIAQMPDGTLYGTTKFGGSPSGYGTAWSIKPNGTGYKQLRIFGINGDSNTPWNGFVRGAGQVLYGTAAGGGAYGGGTIYRFKLVAKKWQYARLYSFLPRSVNGDQPIADIIFSGGALWGEARNGGIVTKCGNGCGTVFKYVPPP